MMTLADELVPDELWALVAPLLPAPPRPPYGGRHRTIPDRNCFAAIVFMARTSAPWRLLPARELGCGSPATCWRRPPAADEPDELVARRYLCIHFPHKLSELLRATLAHPVVVGALTRLIGPNIKAMQSMLFIKSEDKPGQAWHQDELFIPTRDRSVTAAWIALDDATVENGCLWVLPGSHRPGVLYPDRDHHDPRFDCEVEAYDFPYRDEDGVAAVQVPAGSVVLFNGYLLHMSLPNTGRHGLRRALVNHYMSARSLLPWFVPDGVTPGRADHRDVVLVAGTDPYAYKGTLDVMRPHVRPDGQGGCAR